MNQRAFEPGAPESSRWRTIMAYPNQGIDAGFDRHFRRVLYFSNPDQTYSLAADTPGDPMGVPGDAPSSSVAGPADARRTLNETRRTVANFRVAPCLRDGMRIQLQASNGQYVVAAGNGGGDVLAAESRLGPWGEFTVVDANGGCVESGDVVSLHTSDGFYLRAREGGGSTLDATDPQPTPWARFVARRHRGAGPIRNLDSITLQAQSGHYVCAEQGGGGVVRADCDTPGTWGQFKVSAADATSSDRNWLVGGQRLSTGQFIEAEAAACRLVFQTDGNLVAYEEGVAYWSARTAVSPLVGRPLCSPTATSSSMTRQALRAGRRARRGILVRSCSSRGTAMYCCVLLLGGQRYGPLASLIEDTRIMVGRRQGVRGFRRELPATSLKRQSGRFLGHGCTLAAHRGLRCGTRRGGNTGWRS